MRKKERGLHPGLVELMGGKASDRARYRKHGFEHSLRVYAAQVGRGPLLAGQFVI